MTATAPTPGAATPAIIEPPDEIRAELGALTATTSRAIAITNDQELANVEAIRTRAKTVLKSIETLYADEKGRRFRAHQAICSEEKFMLSGPAQVVEACDLAMKPYLLQRERERQAEQRRLQEAADREARERQRLEAEQIRREAEERTRIELEQAEERARVAREQAAQAAARVEAEAMTRADELLKVGQSEAAEAVLEDAALRRDNLIEDAGQVEAELKAQSEDVAQRVTAEAEQMAREIETAPVQRMHVDAPPPASSTLKSSSTSKTYKSDRVKAVKPKNKLQMLRHIVAEADRGNYAPLSWVDHNFKNIDASARQMEELFPAEDVSGLDVGLDIGIRSKRGTVSQ
jgi:hypothetical protein